MFPGMPRSEELFDHRIDLFKLFSPQRPGQDGLGDEFRREIALAEPPQGSGQLPAEQAVIAVQDPRIAGYGLFIAENGYDFPVVLDTDGAIGRLYPTDGIPYTVVIAPDGNISDTSLGAGPAEDMVVEYSAMIDAALG